MLFLLLTACTPGADSADTGDTLIDGIFLPDVSAASWADAVDHPYFPLPAGANWHLEAALPDGTTETVDIDVLPEKRDVNGVTATVVKDVSYIDGVTAEETMDWYAQDAAGNVWYLGEDTCEWEDGACAVHTGSWEWGQDGALPGWIMPASPVVDGQPYFQEYYEGEAEDVGEVLALAETITVPAGQFDDCVRTADTSHLDATADEEKVYCRGVGNAHVLEPDTEVNLVSYSGL